MIHKHERPSQTAVVVTLIRAASFLDKDPALHSGDRLAHYFLPPLFRFLIRFQIVRSYLRNHLPDHTFDYIVARTRFIDSACFDSFEQVVILGAGFDSRGHRCINPKKTRVFEVDQAVTQSAKLRILDAHNISRNHITYISLDLHQPLAIPGFKKGKKTLFVMEGLLMYLDPEAVATLFDTIHGLAGPNCDIIFDCMHEMQLAESARTVSKVHESYRFGLPRKQIRQFLQSHGFTAVNISKTTDNNHAFVRAISQQAPC